MTTSFPQSIGMSASWDPELIKQAGEVTGTEACVICTVIMKQADQKMYENKKSSR